MQISDLLDAAKAHAELGSDNQLGMKLHTASTQVSMWRRGVYFPKDHKMAELCELAGVPVEVGLMWLNVWRADPEARPIYEKLARDAEKRSSKGRKAA